MRHPCILLFHPCSTQRRHWRALECKAKAEGTARSDSGKQTSGLWVTERRGVCQMEMNFQSTASSIFRLFFPPPHLCPLPPSLPISINQRSCLEHVSADRSLQPTSRWRLQRIAVMEGAQVSAGENYDQQSIGTERHTSAHTKGWPHVRTRLPSL